MLKLAGPNTKSKLRTLLNACIEAANMSEKWKIAQVILIPKPKKWGGNIDITRLITLIKSTRKILTKILTARISKACELHNVLKGYNTSVLKNTSTAVPIYMINAVVEHAREFGNEAWFTFQDMKKAYNSVKWKPIEAALKRIKMNNRFTEIRADGKNETMLKMIGSDIETVCGVIRKKHITEKQAIYIFNSVLSPAIEFRSQLIHIPNSWAKRWTSKISATVKKKANLSVDFLASAMHHSSLYNLFRVDDIQAKNKIIDLLIRLNSNDIAGMATSQPADSKMVSS
ncbi:hypothetical protein G9A89_007967 [Geosiphon pyriformis]|nr:hypothetical protein G9A89_007967 [Geosiphon pyriformis]